MALFQKPINMKDPAVSKAFYNGTLVLQSGQWMDLHGDGDLSRFVSIDEIGYVDCVHSNGGDTKGQRKRFLFRARMSKLNKQLSAGKINHIEFHEQAQQVKL